MGALRCAALAAALALRFTRAGCDKANYRAAAPRPRAECTAPIRVCAASRRAQIMYITTGLSGEKGAFLLAKKWRSSPWVVLLTRSRTNSSPLGSLRGVFDTHPDPSSSQSPQKQIPNASHLLTSDTGVDRCANPNTCETQILGQNSPVPYQFCQLRKSDMYNNSTPTKL